VYIIYGRSNGETEEIDTAKTEQEAEYLCVEYRVAYGAGWSIWTRKKTPNQKGR